MSNREGFTGGFMAGAAVGGLVGAVLGVVLSKRAAEAFLADPSERQPIKPSKRKGSQLEDERIEVARLSLEDKIAQLNLNLFRSIIPPLGGMDFSPIIAFFVLQFGSQFLIGLLSSLQSTAFVG
jgi:YGGT family